LPPRAHFRIIFSEWATLLAADYRIDMVEPGPDEIRALARMGGRPDAG